MQGADVGGVDARPLFGVQEQTLGAPLPLRQPQLRVPGRERPPLGFAEPLVEQLGLNTPELQVHQFGGTINNDHSH